MTHKIETVHEGKIINTGVERYRKDKKRAADQNTKLQRERHPSDSDITGGNLPQLLNEIVFLLKKTCNRKRI